MRHSNFLLVSLCVVASGLVARSWSSLGGVQLDATSVADSTSYLFYSYAVRNPASSTWGLSAVEIDIGASSGTPDNLASTGNLFDFTTSDAAQASHAEVGPSSPAGWHAILSREGTLTWAAPSSAVQSTDSIAPGGSKSGFAIRSSYLPGISGVVGLPTVESCCLEPTDSLDGEFIYPGPEQLAASGWTIAPRYMPFEVTLDLLQSQRTAVCTNPLWIDDALLCAELADSLDAADTRLASGDNTGARTALEGVLAILDAEREPTGPIEDNAYWLLRLNTVHVLGSIVGAGDVATGSATGGVTPNGTVTSVVTSTQLNGGTDQLYLAQVDIRSTRAVIEQPASVLAAAYEANPERIVRGRRWCR